MIGIAFIGSGHIADYHLTGLKAVANAMVRVVVGRDAARTAAVAARHAIGESSTDLGATLRRADIDAVIIATPDDTHEALTLAAAQAGKAILLQKPMAGDLAASRRIVAAARAAKIDLQVSFMHRYLEEVVAARALIADGAIGAIKSLRVRNATPGPGWADWFFKKDKVSGGVVLQLGVHGIDLASHVAGPIATVSATTAILKATRTLDDGRVVAVENPDSAWATYGFTSGAMGAHDMSMIETKGCDRFRMEIYGSAGTIWLRGERAPLALFRAGAKDWEFPALPAAAFGQRQHQRWIDGITGAAPRENTAEEALAGMAVADAIARSNAAAGARVTVAS